MRGLIAGGLAGLLLVVYSPNGGFLVHSLDSLLMLEQF